jgi:hypothetical protein
VVVGVHHLTDAAASRLRKDYGPGVSVNEDNAAVADYCDDDENCWPPMGGLKISPAFNTNRWCTSGFVARRNDTDKLVMVTAGHCIWANSGSDETWVHDGHSIGKSREWVFEDNVNTDVGVINFMDSVTNLFIQPPPSMHRYMSAPSTPTIQYMSGYVNGGSQLAGFLVCRQGWRSNKDCGQIVKPLSTNESCAVSVGGTSRCVDINATIELNFDSIGGDSGGPVFSDVSENVGYGIHIHSDDEDDPIPPGQATYRSWYAPLDLAKSTLANIAGLSISYCVDSNC